MHAITVPNANNAFWLLHNHIMEKGQEVGPRGFATRELTNILIEIQNPTMRIITVPSRAWKLKACLAEFLWYMSADPSVEILKRYIPRWEGFVDNGIANSNYGVSWFKQVPGVIAKIKNDPSTRQAVITLHDGNLWSTSNSKDIPCTTSIQFLVRDAKLDMSVNMRSNDLWWGFCNDQFAFSMLQEMVATELRLQVGKYYHYATSMHIYERHWDVKVPWTTTAGEGWSALPYGFHDFWQLFAYAMGQMKFVDSLSSNVKTHGIDWRAFQSHYLRGHS